MVRLQLDDGQRTVDGELDDWSAVGVSSRDGAGRPRGGGGDRGRSVGCCKACLGHLFAGIGFYKPHDTLLEYLMFYHTLLWVVCRPPGEEHISIIHRFLFLLLSMGFNLLVVVLFTATDYSLVAQHCPGGLFHTSCSQLEVQAWDLAQVLLVAVIDTAFWPLLKRIFYFFEDLWSGRTHQLSDAAWRWLRHIMLGLALICLGWIAASAARHPAELNNVLNEFFSTYPAARLTETFKLMSLWGILVEYGLNLPPRPGEQQDDLGDEEEGAVGGGVGRGGVGHGAAEGDAKTKHRRAGSGGAAMRAPAPSDEQAFRRSSSTGVLDHARIMAGNDKLVPLLSAQH